MYNKIERKYLAHYIDEGFGAKQYAWLGDDLEEYSDELNADVEFETNILGEQNIRHSGYDTEGDVDPYYAEYGSLLFVNMLAIVIAHIPDDRKHPSLQLVIVLQSVE